MNNIYIVDDDAGVRDGLALLLGLRGYQVQLFASAESFLAASDTEWHGCALIDVRMAGMGGLELQHKLSQAGVGLPVIVMTGHATVAAARVALTAGAIDFLVKPISEVELLAAIKRAEAMSETRFMMQQAQKRWHSLTRREQQVLELLTDGHSSREIGVRLGISHRTVEGYKVRMMARLGVRKLAEAVQVGILARTDPRL